MTKSFRFYNFLVLTGPKLFLRRFTKINLNATTHLTERQRCISHISSIFGESLFDFKLLSDLRATFVFDVDSKDLIKFSKGFAEMEEFCKLDDKSKSLLLKHVQRVHVDTLDQNEKVFVLLGVDFAGSKGNLKQQIPSVPG